MGRKTTRGGLEILELHKTQKEINRVKDGNKILDVYRGDHEGHIDVTEFDLFKKNIFRKIIDKKIGVLYQTEPRREIKKSGHKTLFQNAIEKGLTKEMRGIMRSIELFGACHVDWVNGEMYTPMEVYQGEDGRIMTMRRNQDADKTFQWVYDENAVYVFVDKKAESVKPAGRLVCYQKEENDYQRVKELADLQLEVTKLGTFLKVATVLQSVDQIFTDDNELKSMDMSPEVINFKNRDSKIETVHFGADLLQIRENYREAQEAMYEIAGVPRVAVVGDVSSRSAKELMAKWYPMVETYKTLCGEYAKVESAVVSDKMWYQHGKSIEADGYTVMYDKDFLPTVERDKDLAQWQLENNVITIKTLVREENPTLTEKEVDALLEANVAENKKHKPKITEARIGA